MINKQRTDMTNLRKKNYEFRTKITELEDVIRRESRVSARERRHLHQVPAARGERDLHDQNEADGVI